MRPPASHDPAAAPWVIIPREIWSQIFEYVVGAGPPLYSESLHPSTIICLVCRSWNTVALETPWIWASISLHRDSALNPAINGERESRSLFVPPYGPEIWLPRAKTVPLQISMHLYRACGRTVLGDPSLVPAMKFISTCMQQTSRLSITCASSVQVDGVISHLTLPAPHLETFALINPQGSFNQSPFTDPNNLFFHPIDDSSSKLRHAKLIPLQANWPNSIFRNLVSLEFDKIGYLILAELFAVLEESPLLLHLSLTDYILTETEIEYQATQPIVRLEELISLCLAPIFLTGLMLIEKLDLPSLAQLDIQNCGRDGIIPAGFIGENGLPSFSSLETLRLSLIPLNHPYHLYGIIPRILRRSSNIATLSIGDAHFLEALTFSKDETGWMFPRLIHLHFAEHIRLDTTGWNRLSHTITQHKNEPSTRSIVSIDIPCPDDTDALADIHKLAPEVLWRVGGQLIAFEEEDRMGFEGLRVQ